MRLALRQTGYPVVTILFLMGLYWLLLGNVAMALGLTVTAVVLLVILPRLARPRPRRLPEAQRFVGHARG